MTSITNIINFSIHSRIRATNTHSNVADAAFEIYINKVVNRFKNSDCFILDAALTSFQLNATKLSTSIERKTNAITNQLQTGPHNTTNKLYIIDDVDNKGNALLQKFGVIKNEEQLDEP